MGTQQPTTCGVVEALLSQEATEYVEEKRRSPRKACFRGISVTAVEPFEDDEHVVLVAAVTKDLSEEGLSFLCPRLVRDGTPLTIRFESLDDRPQLACVVRNVVHLGGEYHRVGAEFTG